MSGETILITRPRGSEKMLAEALHYHGFRVIHEPLTGIVLYHQQRLSVEKALAEEPDAVIVTSRHAVAALALLSDIRDMLLICVGEATARAAQSHGFLRAMSAGGTGQRLLMHIGACYDPGSRFLYLSGETVHGDIEDALKRQHMQAERIVVYAAEAVAQLSDTLVEQLKRNQVDGVTLMSHRAAQLWMDLLAQTDIADISHMHSFCLSEAVAAALPEEVFAGVHISAEATLASLVESVDNLFSRQLHGLSS